MSEELKHKLGNMSVNELLAKLKSDPVLEMYYYLLLNLTQELHDMKIEESEDE